MKDIDVVYSIVIPVYNSETSLEELIARIEQVFNKMHVSFEIIMIDDYSTDRSWVILKKLHVNNPRIKIIRLIRNFGQHNTILAGLNISKGDFVITLDDDLQHPPEEIPKLISKINEGYNIVYGRYPPHHNSFTENFLSMVYQKLVHKILEAPEDIFFSSYVIFRKETIKNMIAIKSTYPFLPAMAIKSSPLKKISNIDVIHRPRLKGSSNYGLIKYLKYSLNLIVNYSSYPLVFVALFGFFISIVSFCIGIWIIFQKIINPSYGVIGWNSLMVAICFIGGAILTSMGIIGEYLQRIITETSHGQQYVIGEMEI